MILEKSTEKTIRLFYDLYVPDGAPSRPMPLLIAFHGYEGNKESMMALARKINATDFIIASIQGPNAFFVRPQDAAERPRIGFGWMMQYQMSETLRLHHETVLSTIAEVAAEFPVDRTRTFLMAFSQSVALNYRFTFTHPNVLRGVVAVCGGIPGDWDDDKYQSSATDVLIVAGESDEFYPINRVRTFEAAIARRALAVEFRAYPVGHVFPREALPDINDWLTARL